MLDKKTRSYSLISLGCARTLVDSEKMVDKLGKQGFKLVCENTGESITVLNTCSFIQSAIEETEQNIVDLSQKKQEGRIRYLAVVGCYPSRFKQSDLQKKYPLVDIWLSTQESQHLEKVLADLVFQKKYAPSPLETPYIKLTPSHFAYIKISEGCDNWCSFCTIPKIRGKHVSKSIDSILQEITLQISCGAKELLLIAEDTTCWGEDLYGKPSLPTLLKELTGLKVKWIRPMYLFPSRIDQHFIQLLANHPTLFNYIDMPIQHSHTDILTAMGRGHNKQHLENLLIAMKQANPSLAIRTTVMVGFPGETEAHFEDLLDFIQRYEFSHIGCFGYSEEKETRSSKLSSRVPSDVIQDRVKQVMEIQFKRVQSQQKSRIGKSLEIVYEGNGLARSYWEAPDVDSKIILINPGSLKVGQLAKATGIGTQGYDLLAEVAG